MTNFFNSSALRLLEALSFTKTLYAFDFDGTLAKIVREPDQAFMSKQIEKYLTELSKVVPVAVISGRSLENLNTRLPKEIHYRVGNHGLEGLRSPKTKINTAKKITSDWNRFFEDRLESDLPEGIEIEDKLFSLALHYRKCRQKKVAKINLLKLIAQLDNSPRIIMGKSVLNLIPMGAPHKGMALMELMMETGATRALYVGDDDTDEDIFSLPDERIFSVRVGKKRLSNAKYYIDRQSEMANLLKSLLSFQKGLQP